MRSCGDFNEKGNPHRKKSGKTLKFLLTNGCLICIINQCVKLCLQYIVYGSVMLVNLSDVLASEGMQTAMTVPFVATHFENGTDSYEITSRSPVSFVFSNVEKGRAKVTGNAELTFKACCDRCLSEVPIAMSLEFERLVVSSGTEDEDADDLGFMDGCYLDTEVFMHNEILVNWPAKILCRDDCKGLCLKCGQNLNMGDCGCDTFVPDPRMAVIQDIFNANKEV